MFCTFDAPLPFSLVCVFCRIFNKSVKPPLIYQKIFPGDKALQARKADNLMAICEAVA
jgi:hypothetical protein